MPPPRATASKSRPGSPSRDALSLPELTVGGDLGIIPEGMSVDPAAGSTSFVNSDVGEVRVKEEVTPKDGKIFVTPIQQTEPITLQQVVYCNMPPALCERHGVKEGTRGVVQYFNTTTSVMVTFDAENPEDGPKRVSCLCSQLRTRETLVEVTDAINYNPNLSPVEAGTVVSGSPSRDAGSALVINP